jgi:hypothetical protein
MNLYVNEVDMRFVNHSVKGKISLCINLLIKQRSVTIKVITPKEYAEREIELYFR